MILPRFGQGKRGCVLCIGRFVCLSSGHVKGESMAFYLEIRENVFSAAPTGSLPSDDKRQMVLSRKQGARSGKHGLGLVLG